MNESSRRRVPPAVLCMLGLLWVLGTAGCRSSESTPTEVSEIRVAAASDLRAPFQEIASMFSKTTGIRVSLTYGASGQLREQIIQQAPFELFASADANNVDRVIAEGRGLAESRVEFARGRVVLIAARGVTLPSRIEELTRPAYRRIVLANPAIAPYGLAAKQALENAGVYDDVGGRLVYGESVSDALRITTSGNADVGIVARSSAIAQKLTYSLVPDEYHVALRQTMVAIGTGPRTEAAQRFERFVVLEGQEALRRYGLSIDELAIDQPKRTGESTRG